MSVDISGDSHSVNSRSTGSQDFVDISDKMYVSCQHSFCFSSLIPQTDTSVTIHRYFRDTLLTLCQQFTEYGLIIYSDMSLLEKKPYGTHSTETQQYSAKRWPIYQWKSTNFITNRWLIYHRQSTDVSPTDDCFPSDTWLIIDQHACTKYRLTLSW